MKEQKCSGGRLKVKKNAKISKFGHRLLLIPHTTKLDILEVRDKLTLTRSRAAWISLLILPVLSITKANVFPLVIAMRLEKATSPISLRKLETKIGIGLSHWLRKFIW